MTNLIARGVVSLAAYEGVRSICVHHLEPRHPIQMHRMGGIALANFDSQGIC